MMAKSLASKAFVTEKGRAADRAQGFQTIYPSRDTLNARGWLENEWQLVQQRGAGRTTCSQTPLSVTTLVVITAYTKLRLLSRANPGSVYWRKESKWKVSRKGAEQEDCVCYGQMKCYGLWLCGLVWQNFAHCPPQPPDSGTQNVSNWSAQQSIHQRVHWDEEINVSALSCLLHLCQRALIQAWKAIKWTYPKGITHTRYWYLKGCLGAKKGGPCKSHGKGLPKQACPPSAQPRTWVSTLGTVLKGHF